MTLSESAGDLHLFPRIVHTENLEAGWQRVWKNQGCAGADGVSLSEFRDGLRFSLHLLQQEIREGRYRPWPLLRVLVDKGNGEARALSVPAVRDRVAQAAALEILGPVFEAQFETCSFAYRKGRSVRQAVYLIKEYRDKGYRWVVDADIDGFFDTLDHARLLRKVAGLIREEAVLELISLWMRAEVWDGEKIRTLEKGIPQGSVISPVLANFFLDELDEELLKRGYKLVRYADDFLILCKEKEQAREALEVTDEILERMGLGLEEEKTAITSFDAGFKYLGVIFLRSLILQPFEAAMKKRRVISFPPPLDLAAYRNRQLPGQGR